MCLYCIRELKWHYIGHISGLIVDWAQLKSIGGTSLMEEQTRSFVLRARRERERKEIEQNCWNETRKEEMR